jgi:hypothetical protein
MEVNVRELLSYVNIKFRIFVVLIFLDPAVAPQDDGVWGREKKAFHHEDTKGTKNHEVFLLRYSAPSR